MSAAVEVTMAATDSKSIVVPGLALAGLVVATGLGSWWTGAAVADGRLWSMLVRFALSVAGAFYYVVMYRVAMGRRVFSRR